MMDERMFARLTDEAKSARIAVVSVVGNGEPTLHPSFCRYIRELAAASRYLTLTTNWQCIDERIVRSVLEAPVRLLSISVDGLAEGSYQRSRRGGTLGHLLDNLALLNRVRHEYRGSQTRVDIRVHLRPSDAFREQAIIRFWRPYGDEVSRQYVADWAGTDDDVYGLKCDVNLSPRCTLPFKQLDVHWNGNVPLCSYSAVQSGRPEGLLLGNLSTHSIQDLWTGSLMRQYRIGHRTRNQDLMPICKGCAGC